MVTTRHKAAVEAGEAPPQPRKHYTEIGLEEFEEEESEHDVEYGETSPKRGKKGKKGGAGAGAGAKKRGRPGKAAGGGQKKKAGSREMHREEQSPPESDKEENEEAKRMRMEAHREAAPEPQEQEEQEQQQREQQEQPEGEEEMLLTPPEPAQYGDAGAVQEEEKEQQQQVAEPETQAMETEEREEAREEEKEEEKEKEEGEKEEPTQAEEEQEKGARPTAVVETQQEQEPEQQEEEPQQMEHEEQEEQKADEEQPQVLEPGTVEQGRLLFFYRPKVGVEEASSISEVQRFYMILAPQEKGSKPRLAVLGKKRLPKVSGHERFFGFIEAVGDSVEDLTSGLGEKTYETKTRGTRHVAAARAVGEATYAIVNRGGTGAGAGNTNLVLKLIVPQQPGEVQEDFAIPKEGSYVFSVKNPMNEPRTTQQGGGVIGLEEKAEYSPEKKKEFGNYAWIGCTDPSLMEYEKCEFLMVAATEDVQGELGAGAEELTGEGAGGVACAESDEECLLEEMKKEINGGEEEGVGVEMQPVETGEWK